MNSLDIVDNQIRLRINSRFSTNFTLDEFSKDYDSFLRHGRLCSMKNFVSLPRAIMVVGSGEGLGVCEKWLETDTLVL